MTHMETDRISHLITLYKDRFAKGHRFRTLFIRNLGTFTVCLTKGVVLQTIPEVLTRHKTVVLSKHADKLSALNALNRWLAENCEEGWQHYTPSPVG